MSTTGGVLDEQLVSGGNLKKQLSQRLKPFVYLSIFAEMKDKYLAQGWVVDKEFKNRSFQLRPVCPDAYKKLISLSSLIKIPGE